MLEMEETMSKRTIFLFAPLEGADRTKEIQGAVDYAQDGDSIVLSPGTYYLGKAITLTTGTMVKSSVFVNEPQ
jgi:hypothetical protein